MLHSARRSRLALVRTPVTLLLVLAGAAHCGGASTPGGDGGTPVTPGTTPPIGAVQQGIATFYDATGAGNCSFDATPNDLRVAAMNTPQYANSAACGTCVAVTGPRGAVTVRIVDRCPECQSGHLDLSREAFAEIANPADGRVAITWQPVACAVSGPVSYSFKEGSSQWWVGIQVRNHRRPVRSLEAQRGGQWVALERQDYNYFLATSGLGTGPFTLRTTAADGQQIVDEGVMLRESGVVAGTQQFP